MAEGVPDDYDWIGLGGSSGSFGEYAALYFGAGAWVGTPLEPACMGLRTLVADAVLT